MSQELLIALGAGIGGMLGWGFSEFAAKKSVDAAGTISSLFWAHLFGTVILFSLLSLKFIAHAPSIFPAALDEWLALLFFGSLQAVVYYFAYKAFGKGEVSILSPIFASFAGLVAVLSVLVFGEAPHAALLVALAVIFFGVLLINLDIENLKAGRVRLRGVAGLKEILAATLLATVWTLGWDKFSGNKDWMVYTACMFAFMTLFAFLIALFARVNLFKMSSGVWKYLWLIALGEVIAYLAITLGYASTSYTSVVAILSGASSLPTIILARVFLKERMTTAQIIACATIILGIILLAVQ